MISGPLVVVGVVAVILAAIWLMEFIDAIHKQRQAEREIAEFVAKMRAHAAEHGDESSLLDDSPAPLPEEWGRARVFNFPKKSA